jgi:hypothetical protein
MAEAVLGALLPDAPLGALIDIWLDPTRGDRQRLRGILGARPALREVFCDVTAATAGRRYAERRRHAMHRGADGELLLRIDRAAGLLAEVGAGAPSGLGPVRRVDTSGEVFVPGLVEWIRDITSRARP